MQSGLDLTHLITHRMNIDNFEDGFAAMISGEAGFEITEGYKIKHSKMAKPLIDVRQGGLF